MGKKRKKKSKKIFERRNIKAVFSEDKLEESTKNALAEEQQRLARLQQAQRDAFANEVLKEFDLAQFKTEEDNQAEDEILEKPEIKPENGVATKKELISLSSDEDRKVLQKPVKKPDSD